MCAVGELPVKVNPLFCALFSIAQEERGTGRGKNLIFENSF
jgi:hypothetical protein